jgi:hypothetical protein
MTYRVEEEGDRAKREVRVGMGVEAWSRAAWFDLGVLWYTLWVATFFKWYFIFLEISMV